MHPPLPTSPGLAFALATRLPGSRSVVDRTPFIAPKMRIRRTSERVYPSRLLRRESSSPSEARFRMRFAGRSQVFGGCRPIPIHGCGSPDTDTRQVRSANHRGLLLRRARVLIFFALRKSLQNRCRRIMAGFIYADQDAKPPHLYIVPVAILRYNPQPTRPLAIWNWPAKGLTA